VRRWVAVVGVVAAVMVAAARVYVGVHYPGDVVAGLALGALVAVAGAPLAQRALGPVARWVATTPLAPLVARRVPAVSA
jgi:undecaprenyl-diphosphatase